MKKYEIEILLTPIMGRLKDMTEEQGKEIVAYLIDNFKLQPPERDTLEDAVVLPEKKVLSNVIPEDKYEYARESIYAGFNNALTEIQELNPTVKFTTK